MGWWSAGADEKRGPAVLPWPVFWQVPGDAACGCGDPRGSVDEFAADGRGDGFVQLRDPTVYTLHLTPAIVLIAAFTSEFSRAVIEAP